MRRTRASLAALIALLALVPLSRPAAADVLVLKDGASVNGKGMREDGGFIWVRTLSATVKLTADDVQERTAGESPFQAYERLQKTIRANAKDAKVHWELHELLREHATGNKARDKERGQLLREILRLAPDHADARDANGEVEFAGEWIKKSDLDVRKAEAERNKLRDEWVKTLGIPVEVYQTEHFVLVDGSDDRDLAARAESLEEAHDLIVGLTGREALWREHSPTITMRDHASYIPILNTMSQTWGMSEAWMKFARLETGGGVWRDRPVPTQLRFPNRGIEGMWYSTVHMVGHIAIWKHWGGGRAPPTWLEEGLGQWVEMAVMGEHLASCVGGKKNTGKRQTSDVAKKKKKGQKGSKNNIDARKEVCIEAVQSGEFPPLRKFLGMHIGDYGVAEEGAAYGLVTFVIQKSEEDFTKLLAALRRVGRRDDDAWKSVYGFENIEALEEEWKTWVLSDW